MEKKNAGLEEKDEKEAIFERTESMICPESDDRWIFVGDCYIRLPPNSILDPTLFHLELHGSSADTCPEGCIGVTPKLMCRPEMRFLTPVEIKIPTWCTIASEDKDVVVNVVCMDEQGAQIVKKVSLRHAKREITFQTDRLGTFWGHILSLSYNKVKLFVQPSFFHHPDGFFTTVFANKGSISKEIQHDMEEDGNVHGPLALAEMVLKDGDEITLSMTVECLEDDDDFTIIPAKKTFLVNQDFITCPRQAVKLEIKPRPSPGQFLEFRYILTHNGKESRKDFLLTWPGSVEEPQETPAHSVMDEED